VTEVAPVRVRPATAADAAACAAVYAPYVLTTAASFESEPPSEEELARRIAAAQERHAWLVAEVDDGVGGVGGVAGAGGIVGYAYATDWKTRAAYRWTCETSVYVAPGAQGRGTGRALYEALLARLRDLGFRTVVAGMTLPNPASAALHATLGFRQVGALEAVGWKHGRWHDVALLERSLGDDPDTGPPPGAL
jgi:L-amino acid N-acyltransferase YncA